MGGACVRSGRLLVTRPTHSAKTCTCEELHLKTPRRTSFSRPIQNSLNKQSQRVSEAQRAESQTHLHDLNENQRSPILFEGGGIMMTQILEFFGSVLGVGVEAKDLTVLHVSTRTVLLMVYSLVLVRVAHKRFMARKTSFDFVVAFILAAVLARAINGSSPLLPTLVSGVIIVFLHYACDSLTIHFPKTETVMKGHCNVLVMNSQIDEKMMADHHISHDDLYQDLRLTTLEEDLTNVKEARLERNGNISFIMKKKES
jgi:hypothetical protein